MSATHLFNPHTGQTRCGLRVGTEAHAVVDRAQVDCPEGCLAIYPPPFGYMLEPDEAESVQNRAPMGLVELHPIGEDLTAVLDYRPVQGPLSKAMAS